MHWLAFTLVQEKTKLRGEITLVNATMYAHVEKRGQEMSNYFNIRVANRDYLIRAKDADEKADWVKAIKENIVKDDSAPAPAKRGILGKSNSFLGVVKDK